MAVKFMLIRYSKKAVTQGCTTAFYGIIANQYHHMHASRELCSLFICHLIKSKI